MEHRAEHPEARVARERAERQRRQRGIWTALLVLVVAGTAVGALLWLNCGLRGCPDVEQLRGYMPEEATTVLDRNGDEVGKLYLVRRVVVPLDTLPAHVPGAFIAVEDRRFYDHGGVDWRRVPGALVANVRSGAVEQGFSTITMQLARNLFPDELPARDRTPTRKLTEIRVARMIEREYDKDEILELYLNQIYFGEGAWGIEAAAHEYFGKSSAELTLPEAAMLAGVPQAPSRANPRADPEAAQRRQAEVLDRMARAGMISEAEAEEAKAAELAYRKRQVTEDAPAPYFLEQVRLLLEEQLGRLVYTGGLVVHTTLDLAAQRSAEQSLENQLRAVENGRYGTFRAPSYGAVMGDTTGRWADAGGSPYLQGAVVVLDAVSGDVLALVGGRDFRHSPFNRATQARRQPGSAFKPFVYATALASGLPPTHRLEDAPVRLAMGNGRYWEPRNYGGSYAGLIDMRSALVQSKNVATVHLAQQVGVSRAVETARRMGIRGDLPNVPSVVLGAGEVTLMEMARAYAGFATLGRSPQPRLVVRVEDREGRMLWAQPTSSEQVIDAAVAFLVTDILKDAVNRGTGTGVRAAGFSPPAAGKTGTTNDGTDVWFVGYTPKVVAGVWIGFDRPQTVVRGGTGGGLAAPVWGRIMRTVGGGGDWTPPHGVESMAVDGNGNPLPPECPGATDRVEWFLAGTVSLAGCPQPDWRYAHEDTLGLLLEDDDGWWTRMRRRFRSDEAGVPPAAVPVPEQPREAGTLPDVEREPAAPPAPVDTAEIAPRPAPAPPEQARPAPREPELPPEEAREGRTAPPEVLGRRARPEETRRPPPDA
jgi:1A family penicillin-binding protein